MTQKILLLVADGNERSEAAQNVTRTYSSARFAEYDINGERWLAFHMPTSVPKVDDVIAYLDEARRAYREYRLNSDYSNPEPMDFSEFVTEYARSV